MENGWLKRKDAAKYAGVGIKTFDAWLREGLFSVKPKTGPILIKRLWIDQFLEGFKVKDESASINKIADETLKEFNL
jgi:hypothetical protein